jgi:hypothetical protein
LIACFNQLQGLNLHVVAQHQPFWVRMQVHLLVYPRYARYRHPRYARYRHPRYARYRHPRYARYRHPVGYWMPVQVMLEQRQRHDRRYQPLTVVLDEAQELQPTFGRSCLRWTGPSSDSPSGAGARSHAWPRPLRLQPSTARPSISWARYLAVSSSQSCLPASATGRPISE